MEVVEATKLANELAARNRELEAQVTINFQGYDQLKMNRKGRHFHQQKKKKKKKRYSL
eukprot:NODE_4934_length_628_cov_95.123909.p3 GENE.NODE_4934_length_628_cov_95.123909~~NODE_4934_length_628_cov_95.123909.p3  ORF type:complete len:58 (+),score=29.68 NODE_4934_length_628_cov_95.123909:424-597(+)